MCGRKQWEICDFSNSLGPASNMAAGLRSMESNMQSRVVLGALRYVPNVTANAKS